MNLPTNNVQAIPYRADGSEWGSRLADLEGFACLESCKRDPQSGRFDIITALPTRCLSVVDFGGDGSAWMASVEGALACDSDRQSRIAIGFLDFETAAEAALGLRYPALTPAVAAIYSWWVLQDHHSRTAWLVKSPDLPAAIAEVVAERLSTPSERPTEKVSLKQGFKPDSSRLFFEENVRKVRSLIAAGDCYQANIAQRFSARYEGDGFSIYRQLRRVASGDFSGFLALQTHRIANHLWKEGRETLAFHFQSRASELFAVDIHPAATIGNGVMLDHATDITIGETAIVGDNCSLLHGVTLGGTGKEVGKREAVEHAPGHAGTGWRNRSTSKTSTTRSSRKKKNTSQKENDNKRVGVERTGAQEELPPRAAGRGCHPRHLCKARTRQKEKKKKDEKKDDMTGEEKNAGRENKVKKEEKSKRDMKRREKKNTGVERKKMKGKKKSCGGRGKMKGMKNCREKGMTKEK